MNTELIIGQSSTPFKNVSLNHQVNDINGQKVIMITFLLILIIPSQTIILITMGNSLQSK
jgi:hypothetical protein